VQWLVDNAVLVAFIVFLVLLLGSLAHLGLRAWRAFRRVRRASRALGAAAQALSADVQRVSDAVAALPRRQEELQEAIAQVQRSAAAVGVLARHAVVAQRVLLAPLRYIGR
jgi:DMSO reductase anchor subunit